MSDIKDMLNKVYSDSLNRPELYHHLCFGGGSVKMLDVYTTEETFDCKYRGEDNWMTPACKYCKGLKTTEKSFTCNEELENYGMEKIYRNLLKEITLTQPKRNPLPDGTLPLTEEELGELFKIGGHHQNDGSFPVYYYKKVTIEGGSIRCEMYRRGLNYEKFSGGMLLTNIKAILWLADRFNLEGQDNKLIREK